MTVSYFSICGNSLTKSGYQRHLEEGCPMALSANQTPPINRSRGATLDPATGQLQCKTSGTIKTTTLQCVFCQTPFTTFFVMKRHLHANR